MSPNPYPAGQPLLARRTYRFTLAAGTTADVVVTRAVPGTASALHYRLFAYPVNRAPEHGVPAILLDQVRSGEDLETSADIDEYSLAGQEGKSLVAYLSNAGLGAPGTFYLEFYSVDSEQELGQVLAPEVGVPLENTGTDPFMVSVEQLSVRVEGLSNLPSGYSFVFRQANAEPAMRAGGVPW